MPIAQGARADNSEVCDRVIRFVEDAAAWRAGDADVIITLPKVFSAEGECGVSMFMSGTRSAHCGWPFPFRSVAASQAFENLSEGIARCGALVVPKKAAKGVNHPDSFEQRLFKVTGGFVSLSLKDKGALQQTYVFLRTQSHP